MTRLQAKNIAVLLIALFASVMAAGLAAGAVTPDVRIAAFSNSEGGLGSGTIVYANDDTAYIVTAKHVIQDLDTGKVRHLIKIKTTTGRDYPARILSICGDLDLAMLVCGVRDAPVTPIATGFDRLRPFEIRGYPGGEKIFRVRQVKFIEIRGTDFIFEGEAHTGESGGGVLDQNGRLVGVTHSASFGKTIATCGKPINFFVLETFKRAKVQQCRPGDPCYPQPYGGRPPQGRSPGSGFYLGPTEPAPMRPIPPPQNTQPQPYLEETKPSPSIPQPNQGFEELQKRFKELDERLKKRQSDDAHDAITKKLDDIQDATNKNIDAVENSLKRLQDELKKNQENNRLEAERKEAEKQKACPNCGPDCTKQCGPNCDGGCCENCKPEPPAEPESSGGLFNSLGLSSVGWTAGKALAVALGVSGPPGIGIALAGWLISRRLSGRFGGRSSDSFQD